MVENVVDEDYLGCPCKMVTDLKNLNNKLNAEVVEQVNDTQELVMLNNFARECNEYIFKKCLQERMSTISSWRWVLEDLSKRLKDGIDALQYEHHALTVVIDRIVDELKGNCKPGALTPMCDDVEQAIMQECKFLTKQKKKFESLTVILSEQIKSLDKIRQDIENDIFQKEQALSVEESCAKISVDTPPSSETRKTTKKKKSPVDIWEQRCISLKRAGLQALSSAIVTRQQIRGARVHLSITAQSYTARVDSVLRRRLHVNKLKLQDLYWQRDEAARDHSALGEELTATEQNLLETMEQERVILARLADRNLRPTTELTTDEVDRSLKEELGRLRNFIKVLRKNHSRITTLQNHLTDCMTRIDCCVEDILRVVKIDEERTRHRMGEVPTDGPNPPDERSPSSPRRQDEPLQIITEEDEDDYPINY
ncbi:unnamed protein product [Arctia plantaginis]|uniref:Tektin n=1 Tax=Arctia plantaginis TaxID=874455 RepID=A0A8S1B4W4_ARCPL|nr:unnamed protein product [Arctia plantaginis]